MFLPPQSRNNHSTVFPLFRHNYDERLSSLKEQKSKRVTLTTKAIIPKAAGPTRTACYPTHRGNGWRAVSCCHVASQISPNDTCARRHGPRIPSLFSSRYWLYGSCQFYIRMQQQILPVLHVYATATCRRRTVNFCQPDVFIFAIRWRLVVERMLQECVPRWLENIGPDSQKLRNSPDASGRQGGVRSSFSANASQTRKLSVPLVRRSTRLHWICGDLSTICAAVG